MQDPGPDYSSLQKLCAELSGTVHDELFEYLIALLPLVSTRAHYEYYNKIHLIWQKVFLKVAQDQKFLIELLDSLPPGNQLLEVNLGILKKLNGRPLTEGIVIDRIDYVENTERQPKLVEYNLLCVGLQANCETVQNHMRNINQDPSFIDNSIVPSCVDAVSEFLTLKKKEGVILYVVYNTGMVDVAKKDWPRFSQEFAKKSIKTILTNYKMLNENLSVKENGDLYYGQQKVAVVFNRTTFAECFYRFGEGYDIKKSWATKEMVCKSNAYSIPPIEFELVNLKRVQTELRKPQVLRRYASQEEVATLMEVRVGEWEFDTMSEEQLSALFKTVEANPEGYIMKPNRQGGGNNLFGKNILPKLRGDRQELRNYILMEKIQAHQSENIIIGVHGHQHREIVEYQLSRFGTLTWSDGKILHNQVDGFLSQTKTASVSEGGLTSGCVAMSSWKISDQ